MKTTLPFLTLLLLGTFLFSACGDDDENIVPPPNASDFMPLKVGAYWVYEAYTVENGEEIVTGVDTMTVVNSYQDGEDIIYEIAKSEGYLFKNIIPDRYRLSNGILYAEGGSFAPTLDVTQSGVIIYTDTTPVDRGYIDYIFNDSLTTVDTPAGLFVCINIQGTVTATDPEEPIHNKLVNNYYSEGVGLVRFNNYWWSSAKEIGFRLKSYEIP